MLVGHMTKDGGIAGRILEHMVDVVLQFEGDRNHITEYLGQKKMVWFHTNRDLRNAQ